MLHPIRQNVRVGHKRSDYERRRNVVLHVATAHTSTTEPIISHPTKALIMTAPPAQTLLQALESAYSPQSQKLRGLTSQFRKIFGQILQRFAQPFALLLSQRRKKVRGYFSTQQNILLAHR